MIISFSRQKAYYVVLYWLLPPCQRVLFRSGFDAFFYFSFPQGPGEGDGAMPKYRVQAGDAAWKVAAHLLLAHSRAACVRPLSRVELAIAHRLSCSDF